MTSYIPVLIFLALIVGFAVGAEPNAFRRRIATFALFAFVVTGIVGCTTYPEVARENLRSVEHWQAYE